MVLGKLQVPGSPTIWITVGHGPTALAVGGGCLDIFTLIYPFSPLSPSLWEKTRPSQRTVKLKTTNQPTTSLATWKKTLEDMSIMTARQKE